MSDLTTTALSTTSPIPLPSLAEGLESLAVAIEAVGHEERVNWIRGLPRRELAVMFALAEGTAMAPEDLVGDEGEVVTHEGRNGLLLFTTFQKRFARLGDEVVGYNHNSPFVRFFSGPGHFTTYASPERQGEVWIDYRKLPSRQHPDFPPIRDNMAGFSRFIFGGLVDVLRRVSEHVFIGDSFKYRGETRKPVGIQFALVQSPR